MFFPVSPTSYQVVCARADNKPGSTPANRELYFGSLLLQLFRRIGRPFIGTPLKGTLASADVHDHKFAFCEFITTEVLQQHAQHWPWTLMRRRQGREPPLPRVASGRWPMLCMLVRDFCCQKSATCKCTVMEICTILHLQGSPLTNPYEEPPLRCGQTA